MAELQAEPVASASSVRPVTRLSPSTPSNDTERMSGIRMAPSPFRCMPPSRESPLQSRLRRRARRSGSPMRVRASVQATPNPTI